MGSKLDQAPSSDFVNVAPTSIAEYPTDTDKQTNGHENNTSLVKGEEVR